MPRHGVEKGLLVHLEVQSQPDGRLPERMYQYYHRIADRYGSRVVSLAVLADNTCGFRPGAYEVETWGCRIRFEYPTCKLLDLNLDELECTQNPAAVVIMAHRTAQARARDAVGRKTAKWQLTRRLYERGYGKEHLLKLYRLIDWLIQLPEELEIEFRREVIEYEERKSMPYITSIERLGRQEGVILARQKAVLDALEIRFGHLSEPLHQAIEAIHDEARLRVLLQTAIQTVSVEDFVRSLEAAPKR